MSIFILYPLLILPCLKTRNKAVVLMLDSYSETNKREKFI